MPEQFFTEKGIAGSLRFGCFCSNNAHNQTNEIGIAAIEHADFDGIERLALVTGGEIVSTFDHPELVKLGTCGRIEEIMIGEDRMIQFSGLPHQGACTIILRGGSQQLLDEAERSIHDALCVLSQVGVSSHCHLLLSSFSTTKVVCTDTRTVLGAGCSEALMARAVDELAARTPGKQALVNVSPSSSLDNRFWA